MRRTLDALASFGDKRVGTPAGLAAAEYLRERMRAAGLADVAFESFHFPRHELIHSSLSLPVAYEVLEGSGAGSLRAPLAHVGWADDLPALGRGELAGKIVLADRHPLYHRSTQYSNLASAGAGAMVSISTAPDNLKQVGSVRRAWEAAGPIPAISIGADDGKRLKAAIAAAPVEVELSVAVRIERGRGQNVVGLVTGEERSRLVIGAHYDTWFAGSTDNGGGVAAMLALAERRARARRPRHTLVFVAWDGEEVALYGGYHFLRRHRGIDGAPLLAVIDFETPSAHGAQAYGLARSAHDSIESAIESVGLHELFAMNVAMDLVPELFGGVIPTDIQGLYRAGTPALATAVEAPYYHTVEDTPDKVDLQRLAAMVDGFDRLLDRLLAEPVERFATRDPALWRAALDLRRSSSGLAVDVTVRDGAGARRPAASVEAVLFHDDFFETATRRARTDSSGRASLLFAPSLLDRPGPRYLHVTAGDRHPLVEVVRPLD